MEHSKLGIHHSLIKGGGKRSAPCPVLGLLYPSASCMFAEHPPCIGLLEGRELNKIEGLPAKRFELQQTREAGTHSSPVLRHNKSFEGSEMKGLYSSSRARVLGRLPWQDAGCSWLTWSSRTRTGFQTWEVQRALTETVHS